MICREMSRPASCYNGNQSEDRSEAQTRLLAYLFEFILVAQIERNVEER